MLPITRENARIFRITHIDNIAWTLAHGLHCRSSNHYDPAYRNIGNPELIERRTARQVPIAPGGTLSDYVPFYFTSRSPMLLNIRTGRNVPELPMRDIVVLVSSLPRVKSQGIPFVFTDRHAYLVAARFSSELAELDRIDWDLLQRSDFKYDPNDPEKMDRYQAEALIHRHLPVEAIVGIICHGSAQVSHVKDLVRQAGHATRVVAKPEYYC